MEPKNNQELTPRRILVLVIYSTIVWYCVAQFIRYGGAAGAFAGQRAVRTYIATFLFSIPLNWFARKLVGLPAEKMLQTAAICVITPPTLEGIVMHWYPKFYGGDPTVILGGAVWLLFAIGVGLGWAAWTSIRAANRLHPGDRAPRIQTANTMGDGVEVPGEPGGLTHVQFLRFAGCPVCNLLLQPYIQRDSELRAAGIREVIFFHSDEKYIKAYHNQVPFDVVSDPGRRFYRKYKVEQSPAAILSLLAIPNLIRGYALKWAGKQDSTPFGLPAEFLIDASGTIVASHYGDHSSDQWLVDDVLRMAQAYRRHTAVPASEYKSSGYPTASYG